MSFLSCTVLMLKRVARFFLFSPILSHKTAPQVAPIYCRSAIHSTPSGFIEISTQEHSIDYHDKDRRQVRMDIASSAITYQLVQGALEACAGEDRATLFHLIPGVEAPALQKMSSFTFCKCNHYCHMDKEDYELCEKPLGHLLTAPRFVRRLAE